jgi:hypothetical protein
MGSLDSIEAAFGFGFTAGVAASVGFYFLVRSRGRKS